MLYNLAMEITYQTDPNVGVDELIALFRSSGIQRPIDQPERIAQMLQHANLIVTARDNGKLVGIARCLTDFSYCCYVSDLAVAGDYQKQGIGTELIQRVRTLIGEGASLILLAAPSAQEYYPRIGFTKAENAWIIRRRT